MSNNPMYRQELPRIYELRDSLPTPLPERVAFPALDKTISESPQKRKFLRDVEAVLQAPPILPSAAYRSALTTSRHIADVCGRLDLHDGQIR
jgi:hypothetical protein